MDRDLDYIPYYIVSAGSSFVWGRLCLRLPTFCLRLCLSLAPLA